MLSLLIPATALAQEPVSQEVLDEWFYSRLVWAALAGAIFGIVAGLAHLCRLQFQLNSLNVNGQARKKFWVWFIVIAVLGALALFLDAWLVYSFSALSLAFGEALTQVWLNYRTLLILLTLVVAFVVTVAISTRLKSDCRCRYAFLPGPRSK
ncbi:MAG: hypothetical protein QOD00_3106 [Blastocatellia bacterium]|jgi:hypothetical protein|nr:hypothetical protein [Blastocatellia bacterium]